MHRSGEPFSIDATLDCADAAPTIPALRTVKAILALGTVKGFAGGPSSDGINALCYFTQLIVGQRV